MFGTSRCVPVSCRPGSARLQLPGTHGTGHAVLFSRLSTRLQQIFCRGRGSAPEPEAVNEFCWTLMSFLHDERREGKHAVVHCTHGYNRTGALSAAALSAWLRLCIDQVLAGFVSCKACDSQTEVDQMRHTSAFMLHSCAADVTWIRCGPS